MDNNGFVMEMQQAPPPPVVADDADTDTHEQLAIKRVGRKGQTDTSGPKDTTNEKTHKAPPFWILRTLATVTGVHEYCSLLRTKWTRNPSLVEDLCQLFVGTARTARLLITPADHKLTHTIAELNGGNPFNVPQGTFAALHPRPMVWQALDPQLDLMYKKIQYLDMKEAEYMSAQTALVNQFNGANPALTAMQRRLTSFYSQRALRPPRSNNGPGNNWGGFNNGGGRGYGGRGGNNRYSNNNSRGGRGGGGRGGRGSGGRGGRGRGAGIDEE